MSRTTAIVLAAGKGTRMKSELPKVLHPCAGAPMLDHVVRAALEAGAEDAVVVVGHGREAVKAHLAARFGDRVRTAVQDEQRGTGHAVQCALPALRPEATTALLLYGDTPLVRAEDLARLLAVRETASVALLTCRVSDPRGYGRIIRDVSDRIVGIREQRDASEAERAIDEVNPGMYAVAVPFLRDALAALTPDNVQGELYLTDIVARAAQTEGVDREASSGGVADCAADANTLVGINDRAQLAAAEDALFHRIADERRRAGCTIRAGARIDVGVEVAPEAIIEHGVVLRGRTRVGPRARIDVGCVLDDVDVAADAYLQPYTVARDARIGARATTGPFAHLRPESQLDEDTKVGNFVEMKKTRLRRGAKASHLSYLGDGDVGEGANIGAGTIFCNYDGVQKHRTTIGSGAFIGSDSQLVAPVTVGAGAYVGTGTTVTKDVPADALAIGRAPQANKEGYARRLRGRMEAAKKAKP
ncbi:MAG: bifunctional UDP-N-acetylglucosamine diphosphorylase/glucosamine-1-phosphate N-acetyltransferase GlmU [Myxococcota bacterium]